MQRYSIFRITWGIGIVLLGAMILFSPSASARYPAQQTDPRTDRPAQTGKPQLQAVNTNKTASAPPARPAAVLYDQYNNDGTFGTNSQNYEAVNDAFDDELADDFVVPGGQTWNIDGVDADGLYFNGPGPATSINVVFYTSVVSGAYSIPGAVVASRPSMTFGEPSAGEFVIQIAPVVSLAAGTYFVSVQPNMDFDPGGQWGWLNRTVQSNSTAAWQNPGGGFGVACTSWDQRTFCVGQPTEPDQKFRINGNIQGQPTDTPAPPTPTFTPTATPSPTATPCAVFTSVVGSIPIGNPTQVSRLFRDGFPDVCGVASACPGTIAGNYSYSSHSFTNTSGSTQCVEVNVDTTNCGANQIFAAAYLGSFDPTNICLNRLGDPGLSGTLQRFSFSVPNSATYIIVLAEVAAGTGCASYSLTLGACPNPTATPTPTITPTPACPIPAGWSAGPIFTPGVAVVRAVGVYFPGNAKLYAMGGRSADPAGSDYANPREYTQGSPGTWAQKVAAYPDNQVNNMACGVLNEGGTDYIFCVGGSAAGAVTATGRVLRYDPLGDVITTVATDPWPPGASNILPGGFAVALNKLYILGGFQINTAMTTQIWEYDPNGSPGLRWTLKTAALPIPLGYVPAATIGAQIYTGGGTTFTAPNLLTDTVNSYIYNPVGDTLAPIASIPRATGETRAVNVGNKMWVLGGGRNAPNPSNQVDVYDPVSNSWSVGPAFTGVRRNFPADSDGVRVWLVGGYNNVNVPLNTMQIYRPVEPCAALVGQVTWQGRPAGYNVLNQLPITLTLRTGANPAITYPNLVTDPRGVFTVSVSGLALQARPNTLYTWWAKGLTQLATSGTVNLTGAAITQQAMGQQRAGDVNNDNLDDITDFSLVRLSFGKICGNAGFDSRTDWTGDCLTDITDFTLHRSNFGQAGPPPP